MVNLFKNKKLRNWGIGVILVIAIIGIAISFSSANASTTAITTEEVVSLDVAESIEASGSLEAEPFAALNWKTGGVVEEVNVKPGDFVKAGDILLSLKPSSTSASIAAAQADLVTARQNLEDLLNSDTDLAQAIIDLKEAQEEYDDAARYLKYLQNDKKIPQTETRVYIQKTPRGYQYMTKTRSFKGPATEDMLVEAQNDLELERAKLEDLQRKVERLKNKDQDILAAQSRVDAAQATVNSLRILAPFDGQVLSVKHRAGDVVNSGELAVNVANLYHLYVETQVDESDIADVKLGDQAGVTLDALPGVSLTGKVTVINPVGEVVSGLVKYAVRIDLDPLEIDSFLPLGTTANVSIQVKDISSTLAVPITTIQNDSQGEYVLVAGDDGSTLRVNVVSGAIIGEYVAVTGDLQAGEQLQLVQSSSFSAPNPFQGGAQ
jgi:HlyD family secretion protein